MIDEPIAYVLFILIALIIIAGVVAYQNTIGEQLPAAVAPRQEGDDRGTGLVFQPKGKAKPVTYPNRIGWPKEISQVDLISHGGSRNKFNMYVVSGTVRNTGNMLSRDTRVQVTFYGAGGRIVAQSAVFTAPKEIKPGRTASFRITYVDRKISAQIVSYKPQLIWTQIYQHP